MKLIDADALKAVLMETTCNPGTIGEVVAMIFCGVIDEQPEAVVRCKDCKHRPTGEAYNHNIEFPDSDYKCPCRCEDNWYSWMPNDDWYCANGERRTDGEMDKH